MNYGAKIFRDDDISLITNINQFVFVHQIFQRFRVTHTIAVILKDIEKNVELMAYLLSHRDEIDIQLHCWEHVDYNRLISQADDLTKCVREFTATFGNPPATWYPPWNSCDFRTAEVAKGCGLIPRPDKISLDQYIRKKGAVKEDTINFHYWYEPEVNDLYKALEIYTKMAVA